MGLNTRNLRTFVGKRAAAQVIATGTPTALSWDTATLNNNSLWSSTVNPTRVTINKPGVYTISAIAIFAAVGGTAVSIEIYKNGATSVHSIAPGVSLAQLGISMDVLLASNDYLEIRVNQNTAGNLNCTGQVSVTLQYPLDDLSSGTSEFA